MKKDIKKMVARALAELGDIEFVKVVVDPFPQSEGSDKSEPLKAPLFAALANR